MSESLRPLWAIAHQAPLSMRFYRQEYWSGLPFPPPEDLPDPGSNLCLLHCRQLLHPWTTRDVPPSLFLTAHSLLWNAFCLSFFFPSWWAGRETKVRLFIASSALTEIQTISGLNRACFPTVVRNSCKLHTHSHPCTPKTESKRNIVGKILNKYSHVTSSMNFCY